MYEIYVRASAAASRGIYSAAPNSVPCSFGALLSFYFLVSFFTRGRRLSEREKERETETAALVLLEQRSRSKDDIVLGM